MTSLSQNADTVSYPMIIFILIRAQILTRITRMILVLGKSALSVPDTRFSRVSGSTLVVNLLLLIATSLTHSFTLEFFLQHLNRLV